MGTFISIIILVICFLLALIVLAQNPKGGGLAAGFTGAQQIGGVQRTADFLEKATWTLSTGLIVLCLVAAALSSGSGVEADPLDEQIQVTSGEVAPDQIIEDVEQTPEQETPPADQPD